MIWPSPSTFQAIEHLDDAIDDAQEEVFHKPTPKTLQNIFRVKRSAMQLHRILAPERELLNRLARDAYGPIGEEHRVYFRDVYDDTVRVLDLTETLRDLISGALDTYLSAVANRTNDIMKMLTLVTVMFPADVVFVRFLRDEFLRRDAEFPDRDAQGHDVHVHLPVHDHEFLGRPGSGHGGGGGSGDEK